MKNQLDVADADPVAFAENLPAGQQFSVQERAVAAAQVVDQEVLALACHLGVEPADGAGIDDDVTVRMPADGDVVVAEFETLGAAADRAGGEVGTTTEGVISCAGGQKRHRSSGLPWWCSVARRSLADQSFSVSVAPGTALSSYFASGIIESSLVPS